MLDVFLVSILLTLASGQILVNARPQVGLASFIFAILISMISGSVLAHRLRPSLEQASFKNPESRTTPIVLILTGASLLAALAFPFLRIDDWLLLNREYGIITLVPALWRQDAWLASLLIGLFLVAFPLLAFGSQILLWKKRYQQSAISKQTRYYSVFARWNMLDVFGLALTLFAIEGDQFMDTEIHWGALFLGITLLAQTVFSRVFERSSGQHPF